jgi:hypothetical protein
MKTALFLCVLASIPTQASAELKYTIHMAVRKTDAPAVQPNNPIIAMIAEGLIKQLLPAGSADVVYTIGARGARIEYLQAAMGQAEGSINLSRPDGTFVVMNPKEQTYWKMASGAPAMLRGEAVVTPTGQSETIAGLKCEVAAFEWKTAARGNGPPDFPALAMTGDTCVLKEQFQKYAELSMKGKIGGTLAAIGLDKLTEGGIVLRQTMRMAGVELASVVTSIGEEEVAADIFEIPPGYKEIPAPSGMGR